jgi:hypothetical protein
MRHEEKYCIWSGSSIGGCPLEEASEQERIPSIIGSIVWCCPTSRFCIFSSICFFCSNLWGMECKVAREVVGGPRGPIVIIVEVIQCKVD